MRARLAAALLVGCLLAGCLASTPGEGVDAYVTLDLEDDPWTQRPCDPDGVPSAPLRVLRTFAESPSEQAHRVAAALGIPLQQAPPEGPWSDGHGTTLEVASIWDGGLVRAFAAHDWAAPDEASARRLAGSLHATFALPGDEAGIESAPMGSGAQAWLVWPSPASPEPELGLQVTLAGPGFGGSRLDLWPAWEPAASTGRLADDAVRDKAVAYVRCAGEDPSVADGRLAGHVVAAGRLARVVEVSYGTGTAGACTPSGCYHGCPPPTMAVRIDAFTGAVLDAQPANLCI